MVGDKTTTTTAIGRSTNAAFKRDELYLNLTVPNLFRCPISMDVMKSPVSLCTGVTYDRTSIQAWLSQGHNTCPATMQVLPSTDFTPNLTLRRLIHLYVHHTTSSPPELSPNSSLSSSLRNSLISQSEALELIKNLSSGDTASSATKLVEFVRFSEENRRFVANSAFGVSNLVEILRTSEETQVSDQILLVLEIISPENGVKELLNEKILKSDFDYLSKFFWFFRKGSLSSRIASAKILESIASDADSQRKIAEKQGLLFELYKLSNEETDSSAVEASLSALIAVSTSKTAKKELVRFGIVKTVGEILSGSEAARPVIEKAAEVLASVATCTDGRAAISEDEGCIMGVVKRLMKCSGVATEHGIVVLWSLCCLARDRTAQEAVLKVNGVTKVLLVMQSDCSAGVRKMCGDLVKVLRVKNSKSCLASYETRTTHIMPY
ncbi:unnamed protein product [Coffea canephora]|uniref:U-box domain-containing protein n=1 Tax=Coffea canephora TaxID=49390 RepID=A0A068VF12_COFCA|nr:unnamed protein product [Coffea canephora]